MITRPMLAAKVTEITQTTFIRHNAKGTILDVQPAKWPLLATPKFDGIRAVKLDSRVLTRTFKDVPNLFIRMCFAQLPDGVDGELITYTNGFMDNFNDVQSKVMSEDGCPDFLFHIFDFALHETAHVPFIERWKTFQPPTLPQFARLLEQTTITSPETLAEYETKCLLQGYEGVCLRHPAGFYKSGRSTLKQQFLLKLKRFNESEAQIISFVELQHNENEATTSELGLTKRSKNQAGLCGGNTLGALVVRDLRTGVEFEIGTGFTASQRDQIWQNRLSHGNKIVTYKYQAYGMKDKPRCPVFKGFRHELDFEL